MNTKFITTTTTIFHFQNRIYQFLLPNDYFPITNCLHGTGKPRCISYSISDLQMPCLFEHLDILYLHEDSSFISFGLHPVSLVLVSGKSQKSSIHYRSDSLMRDSDLRGLATPDDCVRFGQMIPLY